MPIAKNKYSLYYNGKEWGEYNICSESEGKTIHMRVYPSSLGIKIHGVNIDQNTKLQDLTKQFGDVRNVDYPDWLGDESQNILEIVDEEMKATIFFKKNNSIEFITLRLNAEEEE